MVEYAKAGPDDILVRISATNRGPDAAELHLLPTLWFRNTWSWGGEQQPAPRPLAPPGGRWPAASASSPSTPSLGATSWPARARRRCCSPRTRPTLERLFGAPNRDAVRQGRHPRGGRPRARRGGQPGRDRHEGGGALPPDRRARRDRDDPPAAHAWSSPAPSPVGQAGAEARAEARPRGVADGQRNGAADVTATGARRAPAYGGWRSGVRGGLRRDLRAAPRRGRRLLRRAPAAGPDRRRAAGPAPGAGRAALVQAVLLLRRRATGWTATRASRAPPESRKRGRNREWAHLNAIDIMSMPDTWEYPWFAAWDLAFHCIPLALIDPDFAKDQLLLLGRRVVPAPERPGPGLRVGVRRRQPAGAGLGGLARLQDRPEAQRRSPTASSWSASSTSCC